MRKTVFAEGQVYHLYNRGTDKRVVFLDDYDRYRFIHDLQYMNSSESVFNAGYSFVHNFQEYTDSAMAPRIGKRIGEKLVDILAFVLMPNHYHVLVTQRVEGGITSFMQKLGTAYTMYFNKRYQRTGVLFQGPFKSVIIKTQNHFDGIPYYILANPLKLTEPFRTVDQDIAFLRSYKWSSFSDYAGTPNFPSLLNRAILTDFFDQEGGFLAGMSKYLKNRKESLSRRDLDRRSRLDRLKQEKYEGNYTCGGGGDSVVSDYQRGLQAVAAGL